MRTTHQVFFGPAQRMEAVKDGRIQLVVTSPPYPMVDMWDDIFTDQSSGVGAALSAEKGMEAFELMHRELDKVWQELYRVTASGGFVCINIGDAVRSIGSDFCLYPNHSRILNFCLQLGFTPLPHILWRKQTNAPNKFMGSGMLPAGAYVTLEHEYILILRKGSKREFKSADETLRRQQSAFFWEERNIWFSDLWDFKGTRQNLGGSGSRSRSGAFPFELAYRLVNMYSLKGDTVLDPFLGTGTTSLAALASARNSIGIEIDQTLKQTIEGQFSPAMVNAVNDVIRRRIVNHQAFIAQRKAEKGNDAVKHHNAAYGFDVMTGQERELVLNFVDSINELKDGRFEATYHEDARFDVFSSDSLFATVG